MFVTLMIMESHSSAGQGNGTGIIVLSGDAIGAHNLNGFQNIFILHGIQGIAVILGREQTPKIQAVERPHTQLIFAVCEQLGVPAPPIASNVSSRRLPSKGCCSV